MKNRRLTIFCVALLALAATPRAWQEAGKLLAAVQHKAQVKFWSMVLQPKTRESAGLELVASAQPLTINAARPDANCPIQLETLRNNQAKSTSKAARRQASASWQSPQAAQQQQREDTGGTPLSHAGLIAKALKAPRGDSNTESLRHSRSFSVESRLSEVAESHSAMLALDRTPAAALPPGAVGKGDTFKFLMLPAVSPAVASALSEKDNALRLKMLRKAIEEPKTIRQKNRLPVVRGAATYFPAS